MSYAQIIARVTLLILALAVSALTFLGAQPPVTVHGAPPLHLSLPDATPTPVPGEDAVIEMSQRAALGLPRLTAY